MNPLALVAQAVLVVTPVIGSGERAPEKVWVVVEAGASSPTRVEVSGLSSARVAVPGGQSITVSCEAPGFWGEKRTVYVGSHENQTLCRLWLESELHGELGFQGQPPTVQELRYRLLATVGEENPLEAEGFCEVVEAARFRCRLPAGTRSLALKAPGFAGVYLFGLTLEAGKKRNLGKLELVRGASIAGWAVSEADRTPGKNARVVAVREGTEGHTAEVPGETVVLADANGFFQFKGLNPGMYTVRAELKEKVSPPVLVSTSEGMETVLKDPLLLQAPVSFSVVVYPPTDLSNQPWRVELWDRDLRRGRLEIVARNIVGPGGECAFPKLLPQTYTVKVKGTDGHSYFDADVNVGRERVFSVNLDFVPVEGVVRLGDQPVAAAVYFGGKFGANKITVTSNKAGTFSCTLPRSGSWLVQVESEELGLHRYLKDVQIPRPKTGEVAKVDISLPATQLRGQVVTPEGKRTKGVVYVRGSLASLEDSANVLTGEDGSFVLRGLPPGWVWVRAEGLLGSSRRHPLVLTEGASHEVTLVLEPRATLRGKVRFGSTGIANAGLHFYPLAGPGLGMEEPPIQTELDGFFAAELLSGRYAVAVEAAGFCRQLFPVEVAEGSAPVDMALRQDCGTLVLAFPDLERDELLVSCDGFGEWLFFYEDWARRHGSDFERFAGKVPALASGTYRFCQVAAGPQGPTFVQCQEGFLPPGGELTLKLQANR